MTTETRPTAEDITVERLRDIAEQIDWFQRAINAALQAEDHAAIGRLHSGIVRLVRREQARREAER